jgi:hypothetical protein
MRMPPCYRVETNDRGEIVRIFEIFLEEEEFGPGREIGSLEVDLHDPAMAGTIQAIAQLNKAPIAAS